MWGWPMIGMMVSKMHSTIQQVWIEGVGVEQT